MQVGYSHPVVISPRARAGSTRGTSGARQRSARMLRRSTPQPPGPFTPDPALNRESERRLAALEPTVAGFGHGPVITGAAAKLKDFVATLPH